MAAIRYRVPYEVTFHGKDVGSGKFVSNRWYYMCGQQTTSPPAYGAAILGPSDNSTFLGQVLSAYQASIMTRLNHNYLLISVQSQAIIGKRYSTPLLPIGAFIPGTPAGIVTGSPHGLVSGQSVAITGVGSPAVVNGTWAIVVTSPTSFQLQGSSIIGVWSGDGMVQAVSGQLEFLYEDKQVISSGAVGGVAGDSLPLFATSSVRRINEGIGRHFRSRVSLSPMSEVDVVDGGFTATQQGLMATELGGWLVGIINGGTDATSNLMYHRALSKSLAFAQASPFTNSTFCATVTSFKQQPNCGSLVRRKPRLTGTIV